MAAARELGNNFGAASVLVNLASVRELRGQLKEAEAMAREGLRLAEDLGYLYGLGSFHCLLGKLNLRIGRWREAEACYRLAVGLYDEAGAGVDSCEAHTGLSTVATVSGETEVALLQARLALDMGVKARSPLYEGISRRALGETLVAAGELEPAEAELTRSVSLLERIGARPEAARSRAALGRCQAVRGKVGLAQAQEEIARGMFQEMGMEWVSMEVP